MRHRFDVRDNITHAIWPEVPQVNAMARYEEPGFEYLTASLVHLPYVLVVFQLTMANLHIERVVAARHLMARAT